MAFNLDDILNKVNNDKVAAVAQETASGYKADERLFQPKQGNTYYFRLLWETPESGSEVFRYYKDISMNSRTTGQYLYLGRALQDADPKQKDNDIIHKTQMDAYTKAKKENDADLKKAANKLWPQRKALVNIYIHKVIGDDQEVVGKVLAWKFGANIDNNTGEAKGDVYVAIDEALTGERKEGIGKRAFDLSANGRSFKLKVSTAVLENGTKVPNYKGSSFEDPADIGVDKTKEKAIRAQAHDLKLFIPAVKSNDEIKKILDEHWFGTSASPEDEVEDPTKEDDDDEIPMGDSGSDELEDLLADD